MNIDNNSYFCKFIEYTIRTMKAIVRFFRKRAIKGFLRRRKSCILPDISKYPSVAILLDQDQFKRYKEIENALTRLFVLKRYSFIVYVDELPKNVMQTDRYFFIRKEDFDFWGRMKRDKYESLISLSFDMVVDFTKVQDDLMMNKYILTLINNSFRVTFGNSSHKLYDMVIDSKKDDEMLNQIEILKNYLSMLLGKR